MRLPNLKVWTSSCLRSDLFGCKRLLCTIENGERPPVELSVTLDGSSDYGETVYPRCNILYYYTYFNHTVDYDGTTR